MARSRAVSIAAAMATLVLSSCTYTKDADVVLPDRFEQPGTLAFADDSLAADQWVVSNTDDGLNLRSEPTTESEKLARIAAGESLASTGHVTDVEGVRWIEVRWNNINGWVHSAYLSPLGDPDSAFETSALEDSGLESNDTDSNDTASGNTDPNGTDSEGTALGDTEADDASPANAIAGRTLVVTGVSTGLNLLTQPGGSEIIETIEPLAEVTETGQKQAPWIQVAYGESVGWVHGDFVIPLNDGNLNSATETVDSGTEGTAYIFVEDAGGLNFRSAPNGTILDRLISGTIVIRTGSVSGDWAEVTYDNRTGWVSARFLVEVIGDISDRGASIAEGVQVTNTPGSVGVNVRDAPNGEILIGMPDGEWGVLTGKRTDLWAELEYGGIIGWAFIDLLLPVEGRDTVTGE